VAGLLDEVDRARTWQPKTPEGVDGKSGIATVSNERLRPLANGGPTSSRFSFPAAPSGPVGAPTLPIVAPSKANREIGKDDAERGAAHPMSRLKALEGVMDIALARIAELERKLAGKELAQIVDSRLNRL